ncbi:DinB family protein [Streptomyces sp. NPDC021100]|uniref:DinB family protein n=1 Tax=Streptomyces sp. NPDC021100 TaxID=3365114 RepID=UPI003789410B
MIRRQLNRSGNTLLCALEPLDDAEFFAENRSGLSAAWSVGHLACVCDLFSSWFDHGEILLEESFHQTFNDLGITFPSGTSKAATVGREKFPKGLLLACFRRAQIKALHTLAAFDARLWNSPGPPAAPDSLPTCGAVWEHLAVHTYWHLGELAGSMPRFFGTYTLNTLPHFFYEPPGKGGAACGTDSTSST